MATNPNPAVKKNILAGLQVPSGVQGELRKFLQAIKQHIELQHGSKGQPKERFATIEELRKVGLIEVGIRGGRAEILSKAGTENTAVAGGGVSSAHTHTLNAITGLTALLNALESTDEDHDDRITALEDESLATYAVRVDEVGSIIYVGNAAPGTADASALWRIQRITFTTVGEADADIEWADGNSNFDNVWDDRASLTYS